MAGAESVIRVALDDRLGVITIDNPGRRNALSLELRDELHDRLAGLLANDGCRVIVLTGAGGCFSAGGDVSSMAEVTPVSAR
jgi:enoyl-CoA hydratase/carnithine racemase